MVDLEGRIRRLEDRAAIQELLYAYARCADTKDWDGFADLFAEDGLLVLPFGRIERADRAGTVSSVMAHYPATHHKFTNVSITLDGDRATTNHYLHGTNVPDPDDQSVHADVGGWYDSTCRRTADGWRLVSVDLTFVWHGGQPFVSGTAPADEP